MTYLTDNDVINKVQIEDVVMYSEVYKRVPTVSADTHNVTDNKVKRPITAPWEFVLKHIPGSHWNGNWQPYHCCPRCLFTYPLPHGCTIEAGNNKIHTELDRDKSVRDADYFHVDNEVVEEICEDDSPTVTINPSIGCPRCGFHCMLEDNQYNVLSDWDGADSTNPGRTYWIKIMHYEYAREDVRERLREMGYPEEDRSIW